MPKSLGSDPNDVRHRCPRVGERSQRPPSSMPKSWGLIPTTFVIDAQKLGTDPHDLVIDPQKLGTDPNDLCHRPPNVGDRSQRPRHRSPNIWASITESWASMPTTVINRGQTVGIDSRRCHQRRTEIGHRSHHVRHRCRATCRRRSDRGCRMGGGFGLRRPQAPLLLPFVVRVATSPKAVPSASVSSAVQSVRTPTFLNCVLLPRLPPPTMTGEFVREIRSYALQQ